jgi:hypothetical protein
MTNEKPYPALRASSAEVSEHQPNRPFWDCKQCGQEWPCEPAREYLVRTTGSGLNLAMLMWTHLEHYALDAGQGPLRGAFDRFIAWTRRPAAVPSLRLRG